MFSSLGIPVVFIGLAIVAFVSLVFVARNYKRCAPDEVLVIYGRKHNFKTDDGLVEKGFRLVAGGGAFVIPVLESVKHLSLGILQVTFSIENSPNKDGVPVSVEATANIKVSSEQQLLLNAAERLLEKDDDELRELVKVTLEGHLRQIVGTLTIEEMVQDREKISQAVLTVAQSDLNKLGFLIDNFVVQKINDRMGYIESLGKKRTAEVKRDAEIGEAQAQREALIQASTARREGEEKKLQNEAQVAAAEKELMIKKAEFKKATDTAQAEADMAAELRRTQIEKQLKTQQVEVEQAEVTARIQVAEQQQTLKEKELVATVIKPAEAQRQASIIEAEGASQAAMKTAEGEAAATKTRAEAERVRLTNEGQGRAEAAKAEAAAIQARGSAEATAEQARLSALAEGARLAALAEAEGLLKKNEAMNQMSDAARVIVFLQTSAPFIHALGDAGEKIVRAAFDPVGQGLSRIDSIHIVDTGNGNGSQASKFAEIIPSTVFGMVQKASAMGLDLSGLLSMLGVDASGLIGKMKTENMVTSSETATVSVVPPIPVKTDRAEA